MSQTKRTQIATVNFHSPQDPGRGHMLPWRHSCRAEGARAALVGTQAEILRLADLSSPPSSLPSVFLSLSTIRRGGRRVDECGVHCPTLVFCALWCNIVSVGIPLSPIFLYKYIPDQWTTECSASIAAAAEVALSIDDLYHMRANTELYKHYLCSKYIRCECPKHLSLLWLHSVHLGALSPS